MLGEERVGERVAEHVARFSADSEAKGKVWVQGEGWEDKQAQRGVERNVDFIQGI